MQKIGTLDHFFDIADQLQDLGCTFTLLVKHPNGDGVLVLCNVEDAIVAGHMAASFRRTLETRFNPNLEEDSEGGDFDGPSTDPEPSL